MAQQDWCVIHGVACDPCNRSLIDLGKQIGSTSLQGTRVATPNLEKEGVNRVEAVDEPMRDAVGNEVLSSNSAEFALHTDDSHSPQPTALALRAHALLAQ